MKRNIYGAMNTNYKSFILAISLLFASSASISAAPGDLDPTFGNGGKRTDWAGYASGVAIQPDGKIVVVGDACCSLAGVDFRVARYNPDGSPDTTFGGGTGRVTTDFNGENDASSSVVLQPDGKIIVAGWAVLQSGLAGDVRLAVVRYNPDGSLDTTFGGGSGKVLIPLTFDAVSGTDIAIQPNGRILVVFGQVGNEYGTLIRYNADGSLDTSFGMGGYVDSQLPIGSVTVQPADGKIVVTDADGVARFNTNGSLDTGFGSGGRVTLPNFELSSLAIDSAGKIVAAGASGSGSTREFALFRFNVDGSPDSSFDGDGIVTTPSLQSANSVVIQSNGKIVAAGYGPGPGNYDLALARYNSNGSLDNTFGGGDGITTVDFNNSSDFGAAVALDSQGRAVVVGGTGPVGGAYVFAIGRFLGDSASTPTPTPAPTPTPTPTPAPGDLDQTFGVSGKAIQSGGGLYDVAIQPDGKIVTVGVNAVSRYNIDGSPDTTFGGTGRVFINRSASPIDVDIQPDGKIVVASRDIDGSVGGEVLRLNSDGSVDTSFGTNGFMDAFLPSIAAALPDGKLLIAQAATLNRFNPDGSLDPTFGTCRPPGGSAHYYFNRIESVIQPDGKILTEFLASTNGHYFGVFRCNADGTLDTAFGSGGVVITANDFSENAAQSIALQTDGKIVVAGHSQSNSNSDWKLTVARYHPNGSLDTGFGTGGIVTTPTGTTYLDPPIGDVAIQSDGKIVASTTIATGSNYNFALVRYNPNGSPDTTFNGTGKVITPITNGNDYANSIAIQADGKFVVVGWGTNGIDGSYDLVVRYQGDSATSCSNPIDCPDLFVRQHYRDFLNREPDAPGLAHWTGEITECDAPAKRHPGESFALCTERKRANTSAAFFFSPEFQNTGSFILRVYWGTLGKLLNAQCPGVPNGLAGNCRPRYSEYINDVNQISQGIVVNDHLDPVRINANKRAFIENFVTRAEFRAIYDGLNNTQYVDKLFETTGISPSSTDRNELINGLMNGTETRASVAYKIVDGTNTLTDGQLVFNTPYGQAFYNQEFDTAFVMMEYFGYLRRNPDQEGYDFWLAKLKHYGNWVDAQMVLAFIKSPEYRLRFGP